MKPTENPVKRKPNLIRAGSVEKLPHIDVFFMNGRDFANFRRTYIYVMEAEGSVKVGVSLNPVRRRSKLAWQRSKSLSLAYVYECPSGIDAYAVESEALKLLSEFRIFGEWFECGVSEAQQAIYNAIRIVSAGRQLDLTPQSTRPPLKPIDGLSVRTAAFLKERLAQKEKQSNKRTAL